MLKKAAMSHFRRFALIAMAAAVLAGCGSASSLTGGSNGAPGQVEVAAVRSHLIGNGNASRSDVVKSSDPISTNSAPSIARYPTGEDNDEVSETGADPVGPCGLISHSEVTAILGGPVRATLEPLGPTCVYAEPERVVTVVVEKTRFASLRRHARKASRIRVAGHAGWCLRYGSTSVAVRLAAGRVLHVTGPCAVAARFAARALRRVPR